MYLNMGRLGCSPLALYVLALESEASQSTMITPTQTSFNTIKHFVVVCLITQASEHEPTVSAQSTSPASFPMSPTSPAPSSPLPPVSHSRHRFQRPFPTRLCFPSQDPSSHPTFLPESPVCTSTSISNSTSSPLPTCFLQVTVFNPIWHQQGRKNEGRGWVNSPSLAKGLRGQVCPELKLKLFVFLLSLSCCPTQSFQ